MQLMNHRSQPFVRGRLRELERLNRELEMERAPEESSSGLCARASANEKYEFIDAEYANVLAGKADDAPAIVQMCRWLGVSKAGYYEWGSRPQDATARRRKLLKIKIKALFEANNGTCGYRRLPAALIRRGEQVGGELVRQLIHELGLVACQPPPWRPQATRQGAAGRSRTWSTGISLPAPRARKWSAASPSSTPDRYGFYLAKVINCATRNVAGWAMDDNYKPQLITGAIEMVARNVDLPADAIFHSNRGSNYIAAEFAAVLEGLRLGQGVGDCRRCRHGCRQTPADRPLLGRRVEAAWSALTIPCPGSH
jgi:transposase InsO family protein